MTSRENDLYVRQHQNSKIEKKFLKIGRRIVHVLSNVQNVPISCCFVAVKEMNKEL